MRALLSVYDKTGIVEFARGLYELDVTLVSSGDYFFRLRRLINVPPASS